MIEMDLTAEHVIVVGRGRLIADVAVADLVRSASSVVVLVRSPDAAQLREVLAAPEVSISTTEPRVLSVTGLPAARIGEIARDHHLVLHELTPQQASLEEAYMTMTQDSVEYHA